MDRVTIKITNLSAISFTAEELEVLKLGFSFSPTPKANIGELEEDLFNFTRKLRLIFHFKDGKTEANSLISSKSNWTPNAKENVELDNIIKTLNDTPLKTKTVKDNMKRLRPALNQLINRIKANELIIEKADKG